VAASTFESKRKEKKQQQHHTKEKEEDIADKDYLQRLKCSRLYDI
jgi:hypothetical protein